MEPGAVARHQFRRVVPRDELVEDGRRLGVHEQHAVVLAHHLQRTEERAIVTLPALGGVDHEFLEGRVASSDHLSNLIAVLIVAGDADVEGVVDEGFAFGARVPVFRRLAQRLAGEGDGEVYQRRHAAPCRRARARDVVVRRNGTAERKRKVDVDVQRTGKHQVAGGIDMPCTRIFKGRLDGSDFLPGYTDVRLDNAVGRNDRSADDNRVKRHGVFLFSKNERALAPSIVRATNHGVRRED